MTITLDFVRNGIEPSEGLHFDVPDSEYRRWNAFSQSLVSDTLKSINKLNYRLNYGSRDQSYFRLGRLVDAMILEPDTVKHNFVCHPETYEKVVTRGSGDKKITNTVSMPWNTRSNTCKEIFSKLQLSKKTVLSTAEYRKAESISGVVFANREASDIIDRCKKQVSAFWTDSDYGIKCKARFDLLEDGSIWDLKTTQDATIDSFSRSISKFGYHIQAGAYTYAANHLTGVEHDSGFIVVETGDCPECAVYKLSEDSINAGLIEWRRALRKIRQYLDGEDSGSYSQFIEPISISEWQIKTIQQREDEEFPW